jgi:hypothetical protein
VGPSSVGLPISRQPGDYAPTDTQRAFSTPVASSFPDLPQEFSWQIQYSGEIDTDLKVDVFNLDLFDTPSTTIEALHRDGVFVICYFSAGSFEDWRPDAARFPHDVLGRNFEDWPGERWLDISRINSLSPIMEERLDLAVQKGCDGVDPDNVDGYQNDTGFALQPRDQLAYNIFLSNAAHTRGLAIGLKNDMGQISELLPYYDWVLNEECFSYQECVWLTPFLQAGKPVLVVEYELSPGDYCEQANELGFNALHKHWDLDAYVTDCHLFSPDK